MFKNKKDIFLSSGRSIAWTNMKGTTPFTLLSLDFQSSPFLQDDRDKSSTFQEKRKEITIGLSKYGMDSGTSYNSSYFVLFNTNPCYVFVV